MAISKYSFIPWLRRGIANDLVEPVNKPRAELDVKLTVNNDDGNKITGRVQLVGPGDVLGFSSQAIIRTEPRNWVTNFEPNYLSFIEFYDEDFPWRYTPLRPDLSTHRLQPWLFLVVLREDEFTRTTVPGQPLPALKIKKAAIRDHFIPPSQTWAWAHVHINDEVTTAAGALTATQISAVDSKLAANPDSGHSRLMCPRRLEKETAYFAFLIPSFEVGRKAGLGIEVPATANANEPSWPAVSSADFTGMSDEGKDFPIYYEWFFRTGVGGDFEYLVRLLNPAPANEKVGKRDIDIQHPGYGVSDISSPKTALMEGALMAPQDEDAPPNSLPVTPDTTRFQQELQQLLNLPDELEQGNVNTPVITPPLYGKWHKELARIQLNSSTTRWVSELNKDPRNRATAGLGSEVVRKNQETYMEEAWKQAGDVVEANKKMQLLQLLVQISSAIFSRHIVGLAQTRFMQVTQKMQSKVLGSPVTIHHLVKNSKVAAAVLSPTFRRLTRANGAVMKKLDPGKTVQETNLLKEMNDGRLTPAGPKPETKNLATHDDTAKRMKEEIPAFIRALAKYKWLLLIIGLLLALLLFFIAGIIAAVIVAVAVVGTVIYAAAQERKLKSIELVTTAAATTQTLAAVPPRSEFAVTLPGATNVNVATGASDNVQAAKFRSAMNAFLAMTEVPAYSFIDKPRLDIQNSVNKVAAAIKPEIAFVNRWKKIITVGGAPVETINPVHAYPDIKFPMYEPLRDMSSEYLVPNLKLIEQNSITLLETNPPFIESYMVGLNYEFGSELLWREYPSADQRGSYFRQFWDVARVVNKDNLPEEEFEEQMKDIKRIHEWLNRTALGTHGNRPATAGKQLVLVIRGELLKRYPNTIIYAQKAKWSADEAKLEIDRSGGEGADDPNLRFPQFGANIDPDISFIGFDLTKDQAVGRISGETQSEKNTYPDNDDHELGWFFVIREVPGEIRFGLDDGDANPPRATEWDDLSWQHLPEGAKVIDTTQAINAAVEGTVQWGRNSADMATVLYQKPAMVAVHARFMLKENT